MRTRRVTFSITCVALVSVTSASAAPPSPPLPSLPPALAAAGGRVDLELGGRPLPEALKTLAGASRLPLTAGSELANEKVTVLFRSLAVPDAARSLAAALDSAWKERRNPRTGRTEYRLEPSKRRQVRLTDYRAARRAAEAERDRLALANLIRRLSDQRPPPQKGPDGPTPKVPLFLRPRPIYPLVRSLPPAHLRLLIADANEAFASQNGIGPDKTPVLTLPGRFLSPGQRALLADFLRQHAEEKAAQGAGGLRQSREARAALGQPERFLLDFWSNRFDAPGGLSIMLFLRLEAPHQQFGMDLPLPGSHGHRIRESLDDPRALAPAEGILHDPVREAATVDPDYGPARSDRVLLELARAAKLNLAADCYTRPGILQLAGRRRPLSVLLGEAEKTYPFAHFWLGSTLIVRSRDWARACDREPRAEVTDVLDRQLTKKGSLGLEEYLLATALLDDPRLATLFNHADEHGMRRYHHDVQRMVRYRHVLRGYAVLTDEQRRRMAAEQGLPIAAMSPAQRQQWTRALRRFSLFPPAALLQARLRTAAPDEEGSVPEFLLLDLPDLPEVALTGGSATRPRP